MGKFDCIFAPIRNNGTCKRELGDILWMVVEYATSQGWELQDVAETNLEKLNARYPNGFEVEKSLHRKAGDI